MIRRATFVVLVLALGGGCREERDTGVAPITLTGTPRAPVAEEPSPLIVQPHLRRTQGGPVEPAPARTGGGGGGGSRLDWSLRPIPEPSQREVEDFQRGLEEEMATRIDPTDDPCDQYLALMEATAEAGERPGQPSPELPSREAMRENCRQLPQGYRQCLSPEYFREHLDECNEEMARMARRGERQSEAARRQFDAVRSGREPWPGQRTGPRRPPAVVPDAEEERRDEGG